MCLSSHKHTYPYMESAGGGRVALILREKKKKNFNTPHLFKFLCVVWGLKDVFMNFRGHGLPSFFSLSLLPR